MAKPTPNVYGRLVMVTVVGSGHLAERIAHHLGRAQRVVLIPSPRGGSAEARLKALAAIDGSLRPCATWRSPPALVSR